LGNTIATLQGIEVGMNLSGLGTDVATVRVVDILNGNAIIAQATTTVLGNSVLNLGPITNQPTTTSIIQLQGSIPLTSILTFHGCQLIY
jgi:hypothetical protein